MSSSLDDVQLLQVRTVSDAEEFLRWLGERREVLSIDTETTGLEWWTPRFTRLVQFGDTEAGWTLSVRDWRGLIRVALDHLVASNTQIVFHNAQFDMHALENEGLPTPAWHNVHDTVVLHHLVDPPASHRLKAISEGIWIGASVGDSLLKAGFQKNGWNWATVPEEFEPYGMYAALDTVLTARLYEIYRPEVGRCGMLPAYEREMAHMATTFRCERRGLRIDGPYAVQLRDYWSYEREVLRTSLAQHGIDNPNSNAQVFDALNEGGWDPEEFTPTGKPKLDKQVLSEIIREMGVNGEIAQMILSYRRMTKWSSAYLDAFLGARADDRLYAHPSIKTMGARTGREAITGPPLQTLPRGAVIRHCIMPYEGDSLFCVDYDAQELRLFGHYAADPRLRQLFLEGHDPHQYTAHLVYGLPLDQVDKGTAYRDTAKNVRYARLYGAGSARIAATASASTVASGGVAVTEADIESFMRGLDREFPGERAFINYLDEIGRQRLLDHGVAYVTTWGGRFQPADPDKIYTLLNYLIQGSAADILKDRCNRLDKAGFGDWIMIPVHDELLFSVPPDGEGYMQEVQSIMECHDEFSIPLTCEVSGPYDRWGRKYE